RFSTSIAAIAAAVYGARLAGLFRPSETPPGGFGRFAARPTGCLRRRRGGCLDLRQPGPWRATLRAPTCLGLLMPAKPQTTTLRRAAAFAAVLILGVAILVAVSDSAAKSRKSVALGATKEPPKPPSPQDCRGT